MTPMKIKTPVLRSGEAHTGKGRRGEEKCAGANKCSKTTA